MFNSSTDAYQGALKIMGNDYANKYANYWTKTESYTHLTMPTKLLV